MASEWSVKMHINDIFDEEITRITANMLPKNFNADARTTRAVQEQVAALIDELGEESATSQGLKRVITSAEKLRTNPKHAVYLLKDYRAKEGKGEIIGLLKVGRKHLFLFDCKEAVHEVEPLCVLDFYVVHNRQRMGFGRMLFDFVLHELEVTASQMAIDGPSDKMEKFLARNFGIEKLIRQNNNFAIAPNFFDRSDYEISNCGRDVTDEPAAAVGRFAAPRPNSDIANVIHGAAAGQYDTARCSPSPAYNVAADVDDIELWKTDDEASEPDGDVDEDARVDLDAGAEQAPERPASLRVVRAPESAERVVPAAGMPSAGSTPSGAGGRRDPQLTDKGYFDVKYFHNRLCSPSLEVTAALEPEIAEPEPEITEPEPEIPEPEPEIAAAQPDVLSPEPDVAAPELNVDALQPDVAAPEPDSATPELDVDSPEPDFVAPDRDVATPESEFDSPVSDVESEPEVAAPEAEVAAREPQATAPEPEVAVPEPDTPVEVSARAGGTCPITGLTYIGFTPMELWTTDDEGTSPEYDDDAYERCYFDMDQPAYERRDERRVRGYVSNDDEQDAQSAPSAPPAEFVEPEELAEPDEPADLR